MSLLLKDFKFKNLKDINVFCGYDLENMIEGNGNQIVILFPENSQHPKKQVETIQQIIKNFTENEIPVLLTTHSPYVIQALKYYAQKAKIYKKKTNFYWVENKNSIKNVNDDLGKVFKTLTEPMKKMVYFND